MNSRPFTYPLQTGTLVTGLFFWVFTALLVVLRLYLVSISPEGSPVGEVIWLASSVGLILVYCSLLAEYCLDIVMSSAAGKLTPPTIQARYGIDLMTGDRRFVRLLLVVSLFVAAAYQLREAGHALLAIGVLTYFVITLPASMAANVLYHRLVPMLNPHALITTMMQSGGFYLQALAWLAVTLALWWFSLQLPFYLILLLLPALLYAAFLCCHLTGVGIEQQYDLLFPPVDFKADRQLTKTVSDELSALNKVLSDLYEILRTGKHEQVSRQLMTLLDAQYWGNFEKVYCYTAQWFDTRPAVQMISLFLDRPEAARNPMRSLELAAWALQASNEFTHSNAGALLQVAEHAVTLPQFACVLQLIRNHLQRYPLSPQLAALQRKALQLTAEKLHDEKLFHQLQMQFQQV